MLSFVGRIVPIKNLVVALEALVGFPTPIRLNVLGTPEDRAYLGRCQQVLGRLPTHVSVELWGDTPHDAVVEQLRRSHAMVLPTAGENFGHAIAEALSVGCPVLIPDTTPWTPVIEKGAGWLISPTDPTPLREALNRLSNVSTEEWLSKREEVLRLFEHWSSTRRGDPLFADALDSLTR